MCVCALFADHATRRRRLEANLVRAHERSRKSARVIQVGVSAAMHKVDR